MRPLEGIKILDLSRVLAGPFASMIMAELGAQVIKVEQPIQGDETRGYEPFVKGEKESVSAYFMAFNRTKKSITVNLRHAQGQHLIKQLSTKVDVVLENFPVGTLKKYGLDYTALNAVNPQLLYISCTGFGETGPYASRKGYDTVFQAMGGIMSLTGERGGGPVKPGLPIADLTSGLWLCIAVLSTIIGRQTSKVGAHVDFSMLDGQVGLLSLAAARFFTLGEVPQRMGTEHPGRIPSSAFVCADGKWVQITGADQHWVPLCNLLGLEAWANDPSLAKNSNRIKRRDEVLKGLSRAISLLDRDEMCRRCDAVGVPAGPILQVDEILSNEHVQAREVVGEFSHPLIGLFPYLKVPFKFKGFDPVQASYPPLLGEHTDEVLRDLLGLDQSAIEALKTDHAI
jgi:crotonobetainyl-CoA:carnitine CoA-transferase CaiB-like acyl-CoA transferase